jgi:hypothetical protein
LLYVVALCMFVHFCLRQKNLAADAAGNLSNVCPGFHCNYYADIVFNDVTARAGYK